MKIKATKKQIVSQNSHILAVGINDLYHLFSRLEIDPSLYYSNVYGWRSDYFHVNRKYGIVKGYDVRGQYHVAIWDLRDEAVSIIENLERSAINLKYNDLESKLELLEQLINFLDRLFSGEFNKKYYIYYDKKLFGVGNTKKEAILDFYKSRQSIAEFFKFGGEVVKLKDCEIEYK